MAPTDRSNTGNAASLNENRNGVRETVAVNDHPAHHSSVEKGGWNVAIILLVNQGLANLAFFGVGVNLVLFLTRVLGKTNANAANNVSFWTGTVYICSLIGAFLSDSYLGRFLTCAIFQVVLVIGLLLLSLTSYLLLIKPHHCGDGTLLCNPASENGISLFYVSIYLIALGYGGHQPTLATFGADQFDDSNPRERNSKAAFFSYFYFFLNVGSLFSNTVLVYFEDSGMWTLGFLVSLGSAILALIAFVSGIKRYRFAKAYGNPLRRVLQVIIATIRKRKVVRPANPSELYEVEGPESAIGGGRKILHSPKFTFLDKAAVITEKDTEETMSNRWRLCSVTQVEEVKCVMRMIPIWLCTIIYSVIFTQMASLFVEQGDVMNCYIRSFHLPAASMSVFDIVSVFISTGICRHVIIPTLRPTELQRMGIGLIIGILAMVAAGLTEIQRLKFVVPGQRESELSVFWQIPQYVLVGASEVFMYVGQLEFFNGQAPDGIKSFGSSLCMASIAIGNFVSTLMVKLVMDFTARGENPGWIPENLNEGHMDRFYFLIAIVAAVDFVVYCFLARWYIPINLDDQDQQGDTVEDV